MPHPLLTTFLTETYLFSYKRICLWPVSVYVCGLFQSEHILKGMGSPAMRGMGHLGILSCSLLGSVGKFPLQQQNRFATCSALRRDWSTIWNRGKVVRATSANVPTPATFAAQAEPAASTHSACCWVSHTPNKVSLGPFGPELLLLLLLSCL